MRSIVLLLSVVSVSLAVSLKERTIADGIDLKRAEWGLFSGTVSKVRSHIYLTDTTGTIKIKFRRTPYYLKDELRHSLNKGDTLTIIGVKESKRKEKLRPLLISRKDEQLFRQQFFKRAKSLSQSIKKTELNQLQYEYSNFYRRKARVNFILGGISTKFGVLALANMGNSKDWGESFMSGIIALSFIPNIVANTTAGILYQRRANRVPDYESPKVTFNLQFRSSRETRGLFLVGNF